MAYNAKHYKENKQYYLDKNARLQAEKVAFVEAFKLAAGCCKCGYRACAAALDLHHTQDDKSFNVSSGIRTGGVGWKRLHEELAKCEVICANCHRELHWRVI